MLLLLPETMLRTLNSIYSLETLEFDFALCGSLLYQPISTLYPSLTSLSLRSAFRQSELEALMANWPPKLRVLELNSFLSFHTPKFSLKLIPQLPKTLEQLKLTSLALTDIEEDVAKNQEAFWPPELRVLHLSVLKSSKILQYLPNTLEDLDLYVQYPYQRPLQSEIIEWRPSTFPPNITRIQVYDRGIAEFDLDHGEMLPPRLKSIFVNSELRLSDPLSKLPKSITSYPFYLLRSYSSADIFAALPLLQSAEITDFFFGQGFAFCIEHLASNAQNFGFSHDFSQEAWRSVPFWTH